MPLPSFYTTDKWIAEYIEYQKAYSKSPRESDLEFVRILKKFVKPDMKLLDIGCNTGNLLRLILREFPASTLSGLDIVPEFIVEAASSTKFIKYELSDMCSFEAKDKFDVITSNAALMCLSNIELLAALKASRRNLVKGGNFFAFDYFHPYCQNLEIREFSTEDQILNMRSYALMENLCGSSGFENVEFLPFILKKDLPYISGTRKTYTKMLGDARAAFRGALYQPWCFLKAVAA